MAFHAEFYVAFVLFYFAKAEIRTQRPNIILMVADDMGWNDVSYHGSNQILTPNIDALAYNGIILNSHYVPALCTPSRASLLTGKYPTSIGMQHLVLLSPEPRGLPLEETLMPEYFKKHGYSTHAIGKWHLGFYKKEYTPTYRGFDTHFGYWNGYQDYYDHTSHDNTLEGAPKPLKGYDMRRGLDVDYSAIGEYSTDAFTNEAVNIIQNHNATNGPLFLYLAHLAPHTGNPNNPFQAPQDEIAKHDHIKDPERRVYAAMVSRLDESVGRVMAALRHANLLDNSIVLFISDNGAVTYGIHSNRGSNYPLRGLKETPWEGGVRGVAALWSPLLNQTRRVSNQLMHVSDWLPTLYSAAGLNTSELGNIDGLDQWNSLSNNEESARTEVFYNHDEIEGYSALRVGSWKYVKGSTQGGKFDLWYGESGEDYKNFPYNIDKVLQASSYAIAGHKQLNSFGTEDRERILRLRQESMINCGNFVPELYRQFSRNFTEESNESLKENIRKIKRYIIREVEKTQYKYPIGSNGKTILDESDEGTLSESSYMEDLFFCDPLKAPCIFNLEKDPCEKINMANIFPDMVADLQNRLNELKKTVAKPQNTRGDPRCNPALYNDTWTYWGEFESRADFKMITEVVSDALSFSLPEYVAHFANKFVDVVCKLLSLPFLLLFNEIFIQNSKVLLPVAAFMLCSVICIIIHNIFRQNVSLSNMNNENIKKIFSVPASFKKKTFCPSVKKQN